MGGEQLRGATEEERGWMCKRRAGELRGIGAPGGGSGVLPRSGVPQRTDSRPDVFKSVHSIGATSEAESDGPWLGFAWLERRRGEERDGSGVVVMEGGAEDTHIMNP